MCVCACMRACVRVCVDEEEKDKDDWDVNMSVYYEPGGGDKDARDMVTMRRETRRRSGRQFLHWMDDETFEAGIGKFERHSKVSMPLTVQ